MKSCENLACDGRADQPSDHLTETFTVGICRYWGALDLYLLTNMANPNLCDYKLHIFVNAFHVTPEEQAPIHARLKWNDAMAVWIYTPGYIGDGLSIGSMEALPGIRLAETDSAGGHISSNADDVMYANRSFLCIYSPGGRTRMVHLPYKSKVVELLGKRTVVERPSEFPVGLTPNRSVLLAIDSSTAR